MTIANKEKARKKRLIENLPALDWIDAPLGTRAVPIVTWSGDCFVFTDLEDSEKYLNLLWSIMYMSSRKKDD